MPKIKMVNGNPTVVRIIGPYQWARGNGFTCEVAAEDVPGLITLPGFELVENDNLTTIRGIGQHWVDELALAGVVSFRQLAEADPGALAEQIGARWGMVAGWQGKARYLLEQQEEQRKTNVNGAQAGDEDEAPHG
ncbi:MAG: hypothetical protein JXA14_22915 [Anaerolineae bacterium]|nr:hypothetical protein [Anaerolineae bacterium]